MIINISPIFFRSAFVLFDLEATFSYVAACFSLCFNSISELIVILFHVSSLVEDFLVVD